MVFYLEFLIPRKPVLIVAKCSMNLQHGLAQVPVVASGQNLVIGLNTLLVLVGFDFVPGPGKGLAAVVVMVVAVGFAAHCTVYKRHCYSLLNSHGFVWNRDCHLYGRDNTLYESDVIDFVIYMYTLAYTVGCRGQSKSDGTSLLGCGLPYLLFRVPTSAQIIYSTNWSNVLLLQQIMVVVCFSFSI